MFTALDCDGNGSLSFSEFSAGVLLLFKDILDDGLHALFDERDKNGDGELSRDEIKDLLANATHLARRNQRNSRADVILDDLFGDGRKKIKYADLRHKVLGNFGATSSEKKNRSTSSLSVGK